MTGAESSQPIATGENVTCPACGSRNFELRAIDEHGSSGRSIYAFCSGCGNATGKMWNRTVDNRLVDDDHGGAEDGD